MSATGSAEPDPERSAEDHAYFLALEQAFNRLSDRAHLLAPADWHLVRKWHRAGLPIDLVERAMADFFGEQKERDPKDRIHSLRRVAPAVEAAWRRVRDLTAIADQQGVPVGAGGGEEPFDLPGRLEALVEQLPQDLPERESFAQRILSLEGDPEQIENALADLDAELYRTAEGGLDSAQKAGIEASVTVGLKRLLPRLPGDEIDRARERLRQQVVREWLELPWLSLF